MTTDAVSDPTYSRRWLILGVVGLAQVMVVLDATVVNIALPSAQRVLNFSNGDRQWVITAYALAFGSLLPLGGRIGDMFGRRPAFLTGLIGFAAMSAVAGVAESFGWLVAARAAQGAFGALLAPSALAVLTTAFRDSADRNRAFGIFGAIVASGGAIGLVLGGVLTQSLSWRWTLYVNVCLALPAAVGVLILLPQSRVTTKPRLDIPGTLTVSAGLAALVNTSQQIGGSVGTALLNTLATTATASFLISHPAGPAALARATIKGNSVAFWTGAGIFGLGAIVCGLLVRRGAPQPSPEANPVMACHWSLACYRSRVAVHFRRAAPAPR